MTKNPLGRLFGILILLGLWGCSIFSSPEGLSSPSSGSPSPITTYARPVSALLPSVQATLPDLWAAPRYTIELDIDYWAHSFQGRAQVDYTNGEETRLDVLNFRLLPNGKRSYGDGSLNVSKVRVDGQPVSFKLSLSDTVLTLNLPEVVDPGESIRLEFEFDGTVTENFGSGANTAGYGIYNFSEGVLVLSGFYPILAVYDDQGWNLDPVSAVGDSLYSDIANYSVECSAPSDLLVVSTGVRVEHQVSGEVTNSRFESGPARDFLLVASPVFKVTSGQVDGTTVNSYFLPGDEYAASQALNVGIESLHIYNQKFGPYPYAELDIVEAPLRNALGVEFPGIFLVGDSLYMSPEKPEFAITIAHEVAHQWWYNVVGNDVFDEPWLDEALVTYSSSLYYEYGKGNIYLEGLFGYWQDRYDGLVREGNDDLVTQNLAYFETQGKSRFYGGVVYTKGALFFRALRKEIGDRAFFQALQDYYEARKYQIASARDLLSAFEGASGRQLDTLYQEWLYSKR